MKNDYFSLDDLLLNITEKYPQTVDVFVSNGFSNMKDEEMRKQFGSHISLKNALAMKGKDIEAFSNLLFNCIDEEKQSIDATLRSESNSSQKDSLNIKGLLPCPVRIPLLESFNTFVHEFSKNSSININYELKAASMGVSWIEENIKGVEDDKKLPDLFISAGFDMFFDENLFGKFKRKGVFKDLVGREQFNSTFKGLDLKDPEGHYSIISVVPAVFLVNTNELGERQVPLSWEDILSDDFENSVSLPVGDFDLFNGILLNIYKKYGESGVKQLGKNLLHAMHPSQMVKSERAKIKRPAVTIMPYFFTKTVREGSSMKAIWPSDGAIISPIFMLAKTENSEKLSKIVEFFASKDVGDILSKQGLFPSVHPEVDNNISSSNKFMWLGWDYIYNNNVTEQIDICLKLFNQSSGE